MFLFINNCFCKTKMNYTRKSNNFRYILEDLSSAKNIPIRDGQESA